MTDNRSKGLFHKYRVARVDKKPIEDGCIVLEWKDVHGRQGIAAFAESLRGDGYIQLADDLEQKLAQYGHHSRSASSQ